MPCLLLRRWCLLLLAALLLAGCGGGAPEPTIAPTPTPTPRELSASIGRATQNSQSVSFTIALSGKPVFTDDSRLFTINSIAGDLKRPDGVRAALTVRGVAGVAEIRVVSLDGQFYLTNPITRQWQCLAPGAVFDPAVLFDPQRGIENLLQADVEEVTLVGIADLDGRPNYHLRGVVAGPRLLEISDGKLGAGPVTLDLWADTATMRATQMVLVDTATDPAEPTTWTITFTSYDQDVDVRAPVAC